jgi:hypothetical protein
MSKQLNEGFDYHDLVGQVTPEVSVDEYSAKMGTDDEIVTLAFTVRGQQASEDLVDWLERGYEWLLDAQVSEGELTPGKYAVFVEMDRRSNVPARIIELIEDMVTLTDLPLKEWTIKFEGEDYEADVAQLKSILTLSPHEYRKTNETELNEMRNRAGLEPHKIYGEQDTLLKNFLAKAGL